MAKKKLDLNDNNSIVDAVAEVIEPTPEPAKKAKPATVELTSSAFSVVKNDKGFNLVEINFNIETGEVSPVKVLGTFRSHEEARERFKINVVQKGAF